MKSNSIAVLMLLATFSQCNQQKFDEYYAKMATTASSIHAAVQHVRDLSKFNRNESFSSTQSMFDPDRCLNSTDIIEKLNLGCHISPSRIILFLSKHLFLENRTTYNKLRMPKPRGNVVLEEVWIQEVTRISEITSDFGIDIYMNEIWQDTRLSYEHMNPCKPNISVDHTVRYILRSRKH